MRLAGRRATHPGAATVHDGGLEPNIGGSTKPKEECLRTKQGRVAVVHDLDEHVGFELDGSIDERSLRETWIC